MTAPTLQTVKRLFAESGNFCTFDGCTQALIVGETVVGDICHICAASAGGPRFDATQSDVERSSYDNLMLLCPTHHRVVDADVTTYTVEALKSMKREHAQQSSAYAITDKLAETALINSGITIGTIVNSAVSINQQGGITAHTVNQAPKPEFRILDRSALDQNGWINSKVAIEVLAPYPVANLYLEAHSDGIESLDVAPRRSGMFTFGHTGKRVGFCFTSIQQAYGQYDLTIKSKSKNVQLKYDSD